MAASTIFPAFTGLVLQPNSTYDVAVEGLVTIRAVYVGNYADIEGLNWTYGTKHPNYGYVGIDTFRTISRKGSVGQLELTYKGAFSFGQPYWTLQRSMTTIPVQMAPDFATEASDANGAIFDEDGNFVGWKKDSKYAGVTNLPAPTFTVTKTSVTASPDTSGRVGARESPSAPFSVGQLYFMAGSSAQQGGVVWRNSKSWQTRPTALLKDYAAPAPSTGGGGLII